MRIGQFKQMFKFFVELQEPLMLVGHAGIGKTTVVKQAAQELEKNVKTVLLSQLEPGDLIGIPTIQNNKTIFTRPSFLPDEEGSILFLDEFNRAPLFVRQSVLQLLTEKEIGGHKLPPDTLIIAAINPFEEEYEVNDIIDQAVLTRFIWVAIQNDEDDFHDFLEKNGADFKTAFAAVQTLKHFDIFDRNIELPKIKPNPRAMAKAVKVLAKAKEHNLPEVVVLEILSGVVGREAAVYLKNQLETLTLDEEDLYDSKNIEKIKKAAMPEKVAALLRVLAKNTVDKVPNEILNLYSDEELAIILRNVQADMQRYIRGYTALHKKFPKIKEILTIK